MTHDSAPIRVGWREMVALPDWGIPRVRAKIDTGARTSAIHASTIEELADGRVKFEIVVRERPRRRTVEVLDLPVRRSKVRSSTGHRQTRYVFLTTICIGKHSRKAEISLVCRRGMLCRMLVGRTTLAGRFHVDPAVKYLASK